MRFTRLVILRTNLWARGASPVSQAYPHEPHILHPARRCLCDPVHSLLVAGEARTVAAPVTNLDAAKQVLLGSCCTW